MDGKNFMDKKNGCKMEVIDYIRTILHNYCNYWTLSNRLFLSI